MQTCVVHLIRHSLKYVPRREREQVARDLKPIYTAIDADAARAALEVFDDKWGARFPVITSLHVGAHDPFTPTSDEAGRAGKAGTARARKPRKKKESPEDG